MKVAVTSQGKTLESQVDPRFGRAAVILIVDTQTLEFKVIDNSKNANAFKGAGIQAATKISESKAEILLTGFCGPNAFKTLEAAKIKVVNNVSGNVKEAVTAFNNKKFVFAKNANADGHW